MNLRTINLTGLCLLFSSMASMFAYGAFDYQWWTPIEHGGFGRLMMLVFFHVFAVAVGTGLITAREKCN